jgi:hypothetical protein
MKCKLGKSQSLVGTREKVTDNIRFEVQGEWTPTVIEQPGKCLGKLFDSSTRDIKHNVIKMVKIQLGKWMKLINSSDLPVKFKMWIYQFGRLPRLQWQMLVNDMTSSTTEELDWRASRHIRKWIGVPPGLTSLASTVRYT